MAQLVAELEPERSQVTTLPDGGWCVCVCVGGRRKTENKQSHTRWPH